MTSFLSSIGKKKQQTPEQLVISWKASVLAIVRHHELTPPDETSHDSSLQSCTFGDAATNGAAAGSCVANESEKISKSLTAIKILLGITTSECIVDQERAVDVSQCIQSEGIFALCLAPDCMLHLSVDIRKDVAAVFSHLLRKDVANFVAHLSSDTRVIELLVQSFSQPYALTCSPMLREVVRLEQFHRYVLFSEGVWRFFDEYVLLPHFEVAAAAFDQLRDLLSTGRGASSPAVQFMETHVVKLIDKLNVLLDSDNYITRRRSLKLLSEILLDHHNYSLMMCYISSRHNLKIVMNLLRHKSSAQIQLEAFHVFKIFVANPKKTSEVEEVLSQNKSRLVAYLQGFHAYKDDPQFVDEKRLLLETLMLLKEPRERVGPEGSIELPHTDGTVSPSDSASPGDVANKPTSALVTEVSPYSDAPPAFVLPVCNPAVHVLELPPADPVHALSGSMAAALTTSDSLSSSDN